MITFLLVVLGLLGTLLWGVVGNDVHLILPQFAKWIVRRRLRSVPAGWRDRLRDEWLAEVDGSPSHIFKVIFALLLFVRREEFPEVSSEEAAPIPENTVIVVPPAELIINAARPAVVRWEAGGLGTIRSESKLYPPSIRAERPPAGEQAG